MPLGDPAWRPKAADAARQLGLEHTFRSRGRPSKNQGFSLQGSSPKRRSCSLDGPGKMTDATG